MKTLLELREKKGISRNKLSEYTFIDVMTLYQYEKGNSVPDVINAQILAKYFGKKVKDIDWNPKHKNA